MKHNLCILLSKELSSEAPSSHNQQPGKGCSERSLIQYPGIPLRCGARSRPSQHYVPDRHSIQMVRLHQRDVARDKSDVTHDGSESNFTAVYLNRSEDSFNQSRNKLVACGTWGIGVLVQTFSETGLISNTAKIVVGQQFAVP